MSIWPRQSKMILIRKTCIQKSISFHITGKPGRLAVLFQLFKDLFESQNVIERRKYRFPHLWFTLLIICCNSKDWDRLKSRPLHSIRVSHTCPQVHEPFCCCLLLDISWEQSQKPSSWDSNQHCETGCITG